MSWVILLRQKKDAGLELPGAICENYPLSFYDYLPSCLGFRCLADYFPVSQRVREMVAGYSGKSWYPEYPGDFLKGMKPSAVI